MAINFLPVTYCDSAASEETSFSFNKALYSTAFVALSESTVAKCGIRSCIAEGVEDGAVSGGVRGLSDSILAEGWDILESQP
jgi:hypothetical protein